MKDDSDKDSTCTICGKPSKEMICEPCRIKIRGEALEHKKEEEKAGRVDKK